MAKRSDLQLIKSGSEPGTERDAVPLTAGTFGMAIFLVSLAVVFIASLIAYHIIRAQQPVWHDTSLPPLPRGLWASTAILLCTSGAVHAAWVSARKNRVEAMKRWLVGTLVLGCLFLVMQGLSWRELFLAEMPPTAKSLYIFTFYMLTGLHAAHVIGGILSLAVVAWHGWKGRYSSVYHRGVTYQVMYWHFLDGVWVVLFATFLLST